MKKTLIIGTLFSVLCLSNAFALDKPQAAKEDQRVLYTDFRADEVYPVTAASGIITTIVFSPSEQVQSYGSGFFYCLGISKQRELLLFEAESNGWKNQSCGCHQSQKLSL